MNYQRIYNEFIQRAISENRKKLDKTDSNYKYYERHHIIPESFFINRIRKGPKGWLEGNPNAKENLVLLTPEEHLLVHLCLIKIYPDNQSMIKAAIMMGQDKNGHRINNKQYGWVKDRLSKIPSSRLGKKFGTNKAKGKPNGKKGKPTGRSPPNKGQPSPSKGKRRPNSKNTGKPAHNRGISGPCKDVKKGPQKIVVCPHCSKEGGISPMKRYHFDNCKSLLKN